MAVSSPSSPSLCFNDSSSLPLISSLPESGCEAPNGQKPIRLPQALVHRVHSSFKAGLNQIILILFSFLFFFVTSVELGWADSSISSKQLVSTVSTLFAFREPQCPITTKRNLQPSLYPHLDRDPLPEIQLPTRRPAPLALLKRRRCIPP